ncbi:MAG: hypothetical protein J6S67_01870 [Methanobrevibacter sp.]|nr:hypothetical protein [Methanobrevibacter sp.]
MTFNLLIEKGSASDSSVVTGVSDFMFSATVKDVIYKLLHDVDSYPDHVVITIDRVV